MRSVEQLTLDVSNTALVSQFANQAQRDYKPDKHFKISEAEFRQLHSRMTTLNNTGWHLWLGVPVWVTEHEPGAFDGTAAKFGPA